MSSTERLECDSLRVHGLSLECYAQLAKDCLSGSIQHAFSRGDTVKIFSVEGPGKRPIMEGIATIVSPIADSPTRYRVKFENTDHAVERAVFTGRCQTNPGFFLEVLLLQWKRQVRNNTDQGRPSDGGK